MKTIASPFAAAPLAASLAAALALALSAPLSAADGWDPVLDVRYRYEHVDDDARPLDAHAQTVRARLGLLTPVVSGFSAYAEVEAVEAIDERYDSTANGRTRYAVVADPEATELNQAWVRYKHADSPFAATAGRQRVTFDNQRFFGNVGFRQNEQTFDALQLESLFAGTTLRYAYLDEVHRVFGDDHPNPLSAEQKLDAHLVNASRAIGPGTLVGYGYFVENEDLPATSARTVGARWASTHAVRGDDKLLVTAELARQDDYADGNENIGANYALAELGYGFGAHTFRAGVERLGSNGRQAFQTPFATLHAFNGWADRFLTTPAAGLVDSYVSYATKLGGQYDAIVAWHAYDADRGAADYGTELDVSLRRTFSAHVDAEIKAADFRGENGTPDVRKLWLMVTLKY